jgi:hypothetical protein
MRRTVNNCDVIEDNGVILGINLGFDHAAEHEWGFEWASRHLGRPEKVTMENHGVRGRTTTSNPEYFLELVAFKDELWLRGSYRYRDDDSLINELKNPKARSHYTQELCDNRPSGRPGSTLPELRAGWNTNSGFCVIGTSDRAKEAIVLVHKALVDKACFMFQQGGLMMLDARLIPASYEAALIKEDLAKFELERTVDKSGIRDRLQVANLRYYALSPAWSKTMERDGKRSLQFWLNPMDQHQNNSGWFTVKDLDDWIAGKGKIPMNPKK